MSIAAVADPSEGLADDIEEALDRLGPDAATIAAEGDRYRIDGYNSADWVARRLIRARTEQAEYHATVRRQIDAIKAVAETHIAPLLEALAEADRIFGNDIEWAEVLLTQWHHDELEAELAERGGDWSKVRRKTNKLPSGVHLHARKQPDHWEFDEEQVIPWARTHGEYAALLRVKVEVDRAEAKRVMRVVGDQASVEWGESVPGITVTPGEVAYTVEVPS